MTTFTPTIAWCTPCVERARRAHCFTPGDVISHVIGSSSEQSHCHLHTIHGALSLIRPLPSSFTFPSCPSPSTCYSAVEKSEGTKNYGADQQRLQISDLHFDNFTTPATFACWKIRFKTEVCTCSQLLTEALQWIKEVEMVDSVKVFVINKRYSNTKF